MVNLGFVLHHVFKTWKFATFMQECIPQILLNLLSSFAMQKTKQQILHCNINLIYFLSSQLYFFCHIKYSHTQPDLL